MSVEADFEDAFRTVSDAVRKIRDSWKDIVDGVNWVIDILPGFLAGRLRDGFNHLAAKVNQFFDEIGKFLTQPGSVGAVRSVADDWNTRVGGKASTQAGLLAWEALATGKEWDGKAAAAYRDVVTEQDKALGSIKTITDALQTILYEIASAIKVFWVALAVAVATYVVAMAVCAIGAATVVGAVPAIAAGVTASVAVLTATATFTTNFVNTLDSQKAKIEQQTTTDGSFSNGNWPPAVTETMSDASVKHGHKGDWTPK